jgi:hypothetical protein
LNSVAVTVGEGISDQLSGQIGWIKTGTAATGGQALSEAESHVEELRRELDVLESTAGAVFEAPPLPWVAKRLAAVCDLLRRQQPWSAVGCSGPVRLCALRPEVGRPYYQDRPRDPRSARPGLGGRFELAATVDAVATNSNRRPVTPRLLGPRGAAGVYPPAGRLRRRSVDRSSVFRRPPSVGSSGISDKTVTKAPTRRSPMPLRGGPGHRRPSTREGRPAGQRRQIARIPAAKPLRDSIAGRS